jgi:hypothetical protein
MDKRESLSWNLFHVGALDKYRQPPSTPNSMLLSRMSVKTLKYIPMSVLHAKIIVKEDFVHGSLA